MLCIVESDKSIIWIIHPSTHQEMASSDLLPTQIDVESWLEYIMLLAKPINNLILEQIPWNPKMVGIDPPVDATLHFGLGKYLVYACKQYSTKKKWKLAGC